MASQEQIHPRTTAIVERFHAVLYPFPMERVLEALPAKGWIVPFSDRDDSGVKLSAAPSKGNVKLVFATENKTVGVRGVDPAEALQEFKEITQFLLNEFGLSPEVRSHYTELRFVGTADGAGPGRKPPPEMLETWWSGHPRSVELALQLQKFLPGDPIGVYGIRMATRGKDANRANWAELTIAPAPTSGTRFYNFDLIYRNENREVVEGVTGNVVDLISAAVKELEK